jgi:hypothetical protein
VGGDGASSLWHGLNSSRSQVGAGLDPDSSSRFPIRSENQIMPRSSARSSLLRQDAGADAVGPRCIAFDDDRVISWVIPWRISELSPGGGPIRPYIVWKDRFTWKF